MSVSKESPGRGKGTERGGGTSRSSTHSCFCSNNSQDNNDCRSERELTGLSHTQTILLPAILVPKSNILLIHNYRTKE